MTEPDITYRKFLHKQTVNDLKGIEQLYQELDILWQELDDHDRNGRTSESKRILTEIRNINREITVTENRCRTRLGLKKL
jgi:hypothetical protein